MSDPIDAQITRSRRELLDLTARNRLINTPLTRSRSSRLDVTDELSSEVFRIIVQERREMAFLSAEQPETEEQTGSDDAEQQEGQATPSDDSVDAPDGSDDEDALHFAQPIEDDDGIADRHLDKNLQTPLDDEKLQKKLLRLFYDARGFYEEQGVNSLYLAMGFLEWYESPTSDKPRYAPLLLIPVELHRRTVNARFRLRMLDDDLTTNLSLQEKLKAEFGLQLPEVPEVDDLSPAEYFDVVQKVVEGQPRWRLHRDRMTLWFFSFAKFLMFRDLNPEVWPEGKGPKKHAGLRGLLGEATAFMSPLIGEHENLDDRINARDLTHIMDADSSQAAAIEEVRHGRNLVIQGPPGTGKSQTITNLIAAAVNDGKKVLFVAEKMAALEVVKSRLDRIGLGDLCLELHSHKANRRSVLNELERTLQLGRPANKDVEKPSADLERVRDRLNAYVQQLHSPVSPSQQTPFQLIGTLSRLQASGTRRFEKIPDGIEDWSTSTLEEKQAILNDILEHVTELGPPATHAWRGVQRQLPFLPADVQQMERDIRTLSSALNTIQQHGEALADSLKILWNNDSASFSSTQQLALFASKLQSIPPMDRNAFADPVWESKQNEISKIASLGREWKSCKDELEGVLAPTAWHIDVVQTRTDLAANGDSFFRWFSGRWREASRSLKGLLRDPPPKTLQNQLQILDSLFRWQQLAQQLGSNGELHAVASEAFGEFWKDDDSDWDQLQAIVDWNQDCSQNDLPADFRQAIGSWSAPAQTESAFVLLRAVLQDAFNELKKLRDLLDLFSIGAFDAAELSDVPLTVFGLRFDEWLGAIGQLNRWVILQRRRADLIGGGLESLLPEIDSGTIGPDAMDRLTLVFTEAAMKLAYAQFDTIAEFDGVTHSRIVDEFRELDQRRIQLARHETASAHFEGIPVGSDYGSVGIIRGEIRKKRRHKQIRRLLTDAGHAVQAMKPVFMMSPISIAQFIEPGVLEFDLLVIDEASQVRPVEAFGAVMRSRQAVVVGDNRQLPPTSFFDRMSGSDDDEPEEDDETTSAADVESILDLCVARNFPQRMLQWHYRSRHHSLIAVSNREFYQDRLFVIPSAERDGGTRGLQFRHITNGIFDRGKLRTNRQEARAVAEAMIEHARSTPRLTLGVGTFSVAQRDAILDELELLRRDHPETEDFFSLTSAEPWFVKNLENIQGDERDVILISVGYGFDASGYFSMNFGPLNREGGERRLNVLITRARERCVVFSSITADDIDLRRTSALGVKSLKTFLHFAKTGLMETAEVTGRDFDSDFEIDVANAIRSLGYDVDQQVGMAGFFIDLAVVDPNCPGRYILGVECDGATYHSARWARDRDRLRQAVLEDHGWALHRIWSTDWFQSRDDQLRKLAVAIEKQLLSDRRDTTPTNDNPPDDNSSGGEVTVDSAEKGIERDSARDDEGTDNGTECPDYEEAAFHLEVMSEDVHTLSAEELSKVVTQVVRVEGPIHENEIVRRITTLWGLSRAGRRITDAVHAAIKYAKSSGTISTEDDFYWHSERTEFPIRNRDRVESSGLKKPEMLPPRELQSGIFEFVENHVSATSEETARAIGRMLGFRTTSRQLRERIEEEIETLVSQNELILENGLLRLHRQQGN
jgi:very-short-patch-repair endonuclease/DNA polymerase III delta prime subunit